MQDIEQRESSILCKTTLMVKCHQPPDGSIIPAGQSQPRNQTKSCARRLSPAELRLQDVPGATLVDPVHEELRHVADAAAFSNFKVSPRSLSDRNFMRFALASLSFSAFSCRLSGSRIALRKAPHITLDNASWTQNITTLS